MKTKIENETCPACKTQLKKAGIHSTPGAFYQKYKCPDCNGRFTNSEPFTKVVSDEDSPTLLECVECGYIWTPITPPARTRRNIYPHCPECAENNDY
jgi:transposase-like protein